MLNPEGGVVNEFNLLLALEDMPPLCSTFVRQRVAVEPEQGNSGKSPARHLIHLR